jgi:adenylate kinase family enzyme
MKRILIIGCPGAGKTTFACRLAEKTGLPLTHLDRLFWQGEWETVSREEFDARLAAVLAEPVWILDGNYDRTLPLRLSYADTVFFFDLPTVSCLWGVTKRVLTNYGKCRPDMGGHCPERLDKHTRELYRHVLAFRRNHRAAYRRLLAEAEAKGKTVVTLRSRRAVDAYRKALTDRKE